MTETFKVYYTDAPEAYDYGYTNRYDDQRYVNRSGEPVYRVEIPEESADYQTGRYMSGLYAVLTEEQADYEARTYEIGTALVTHREETTE